MTCIDVISPLLESISNLSGMACQVRYNGRPIMNTRSFMADTADIDLEATIEQFESFDASFHSADQPNGNMLCAIPLEDTRRSGSWFIASVPVQDTGTIHEEIIPLLKSLIEMLQACQADKHEIDELAVALDRSFEELALYRRIQKSFRTGTISNSEMADIVTLLKELLQADLVMGHFPASPDLCISFADSALQDRIEIEKFKKDLIDKINAADVNDGEHYYVLNNSSSDPDFSSLSKRPFRLMVSHAVHNETIYGWVCAVSFDFYTFFSRSHLNMMQAAASEAGLVGANTHLQESLEGLTTQVSIFQNALNKEQGRLPRNAQTEVRQTVQFLGEAFTQLSENIGTAKALMRRNTQLAALGQMAAVFAHEIKQPVCALDGFIQLRQLKQPDPDEADSLKVMAKSVHRMSRIIRRFESFSRPHEQRWAQVSLNEIVREVYYLVKPQLELKQIDGNLQRAKGLPGIMGDAQNLQQSVLNLISNSIHAMDANNGDGSELLLKTYQQEDLVCLEVKDNGHGIPEDLLHKICDPYVTTKPPEEGTGLGLAVVADTIDQHGGRLDIDSKPGLGCRFTLKIPALASRLENSKGRRT